MVVPAKAGIPLGRIPAWNRAWKIKLIEEMNPVERPFRAGFLIL
jgi:hypothetical protein